MAGVLGAFVFLSAVVTLHLVRRDISPVDGFVSDYANGWTRSLFTVAVLGHGVGNVALAVGLGVDLGTSRTARWGAFAFGAAGIGLLIAGVFRTDPAYAPPSMSGQVHSGAVSISFLVELAALLVFAGVFRLHPDWRAYARPTLVLAILAGATMLWMLVAVEMHWVPGIAERTALGVFLIWEFLAAYRLVFRRPASDQPAIVVAAQRTAGSRLEPAVHPGSGSTGGVGNGRP